MWFVFNIKKYSFIGKELFKKRKTTIERSFGNLK